MRFLLDQHVYEVTARHLRDSSHDVIRADAIGLGRGNDSDRLAAAVRQQRIFVTRDRDFGGLVFLGSRRCGVIYPRVRSSTAKSVHLELDEVLGRHAEEQLRNAFVVVEPGRYRFRNLPGT